MASLDVTIERAMATQRNTNGVLNWSGLIYSSCEIINGKNQLMGRRRLQGKSILFADLPNNWLPFVLYTGKSWLQYLKI